MVMTVGWFIIALPTSHYESLSISPWEKKTSWDWTELPMNAMNAYATYGYGSIAMKIAFLGG